MRALANGQPRRARRIAAAAALALSAAVAAACSGGSPTSTASGPAAPSSSPSPAPAQLTVSFTGDILVHSPVYRQAAVYGRASGRSYDFRPMFARVQAGLSASDLAICHQETPLLPDDRGVSGYPVFNTPPEIADAIAAAGYDGCSTASNHSYDRGAAGVASTLAQLDRVRVAHVGTARTPSEGARPEVHTVRGVKVALLDYTYGLNGLTVPASQAFSVDMIDVPAILRDAHAARTAGAQIVVVQMHWGQEYQTQPTAQQRAQARQLLASPDVDAIVGGHVHVIQPVEKIGGKYVVYGTGNFLSNQSPECCPPASQDGVIATLHFGRAGERWSVNQVSYTPTYVDRSAGYVILPVAQAYPSANPALAKALGDSWRRTVAAMTAMRAPGVVPDARPPGL